MKDIKFDVLTNFTGRNGYGKCSGIELLHGMERDGQQCFMLTPLTSKGNTANCDILIPVSAIEGIVRELLHIKNKGLDSNICPHCGSDNISAGYFDAEGEVCPVVCDDCGERWSDHYIYSGQSL